MNFCRYSRLKRLAAGDYEQPSKIMKYENCLLTSSNNGIIIGRQDTAGSLYNREKLLVNGYFSAKRADLMMREDFSASNPSLLAARISRERPAKFPDACRRPEYLDIDNDANNELLARVPPLIYIPPLHHNHRKHDENNHKWEEPRLPNGLIHPMRFDWTFVDKPSPPANKDQQNVRACSGSPFRSADDAELEPNKWNENRFTSKRNSIGEATPRKANGNVDSGNCLSAYSKVERRIKCNYCPRKFLYISHMKVHERVHTGEKPYSCKFCSCQFSQPGSLTVHMRRHTGAKPYQCRQCSKHFRHVNCLKRHQRQVHKMTTKDISLSTSSSESASFLKHHLGDQQEEVDRRRNVNCETFSIRNEQTKLWNTPLKTKFTCRRVKELCADTRKVSKSLQYVDDIYARPQINAPRTWRPYEDVLAP